MSSIEEAAADLDSAATTLDEAWDFISQGKEKLSEARQILAGVGGLSPHETLALAISLANEAYSQAESSQGHASAAKNNAEEYKGIISG